MPRKLTTNWQVINSPTKPGPQHVPGLGNIGNITQDDIDAVQALGGDPVVFLRSVGAAQAEEWEICHIGAMPRPAERTKPQPTE